VITQSFLVRASHIELTNIRAIDGDTLQAHLVLPLGILAQRRIRLKTFAAPEHHGANPDMAEGARAKLQNAVDRGKCHIATHGMREDRYGRIAAVLWIDGKPVTGTEILGSLQLSDEEHRREVARARACRI
jgi:endonuclease YncB( thermonuclease family)